MKEKKERMIQTSTFLRRDQLQNIDNINEITNISKAEIIRTAIDEYFKTHQKKEVKE